MLPCYHSEPNLFHQFNVHLGLLPVLYTNYDIVTYVDSVFVVNREVSLLISSGFSTFCRASNYLTVLFVARRIPKSKR